MKYISPVSVPFGVTFGWSDNARPMKIRFVPAKAELTAPITDTREVIDCFKHNPGSRHAN